MVVANFL